MSIFAYHLFNNSMSNFWKYIAIPTVTVLFILDIFVSIAWNNNNLAFLIARKDLPSGLCYVYFAIYDVRKIVGFSKP